MQPSVRICRESLLTESSRMILSGRKGATAPFSCLPARTGSGRARSWVKGWIPCGDSGQRPEPSESFSSSISTVFKVLLSLFFHGSFFIDYLTLPNLSLFYKREFILMRIYAFFIKVKNSYTPPLELRFVISESRNPHERYTLMAL